MPISQDANRELLAALLDAAALVERRLTGTLSNIKGISYAEFRLLAALETQHNASASRVNLAGLVGMTPSGVTRALKPLEKLGYVETVRNERDARQALAVLTDQGRELVVDGTGVVNDSIATIMERVPITVSEGATVTRFCHDLAGH